MAVAATKPAKCKRGFASMSVELQRAIARKGGRSVPAEKRFFSTRRDLASDAGRRGGLAAGRRSASNSE